MVLFLVASVFPAPHSRRIIAQHDECSMRSVAFFYSMLTMDRCTVLTNEHCTLRSLPARQGAGGAWSPRRDLPVCVGAVEGFEYV